MVPNDKFRIQLLTKQMFVFSKITLIPFQSEEFRKYQENVVKNAQAMASELESLGYRIVTGGTDNHIVLLDMSTVKLSGAKAERILELVEISVNKNTGMLSQKALSIPRIIRYLIR